MKSRKAIMYAAIAKNGLPKVETVTRKRSTCRRLNPFYHIEKVVVTVTVYKKPTADDLALVQDYKDYISERN